MNFDSRRIRTTLLLLVTIFGLVMSFGENVLCAGELPGTHDTASYAHEQVLSQTNENTHSNTPTPSNPPHDHFCIGDCGCPCQAPLTSAAIIFTCSRSFTYLYPTEITRHIPEVFLSLFVPPDSATV